MKREGREEVLRDRRPRLGHRLEVEADERVRMTERPSGSGRACRWQGLRGEKGVSSMKETRYKTLTQAQVRRRHPEELSPCGW